MTWAPEGQGKDQNARPAEEVVAEIKKAGGVAVATMHLGVSGRSFEYLTENVTQYLGFMK